MTEAEGELVESAFFFGTRIEAYLHDTVKVQKGDCVAMLRTLIEIADGETILTDGDADANAKTKVQFPNLSGELRKAIVDTQVDRRAEDKEQAEILVDLFKARSVLAARTRIDARVWPLLLCGLCAFA